MHVRRTPRFDEEVERFALCFTCEDCAYFDGVLTACAHEWPTEEHRLARYRQALDESSPQAIVFCKEFELL